MSASKKLQARDALDLVKQCDEIYIAKGKNVTYFDFSKEKPDEATLLSHLLGPTGNLRAPAFLKGRTLVVGFNQEQYEEVFK